MGWFTNKKVKDERIVHMQNKIYREIYILIVVVCSISAFVKYLYYGLEFERVITECIILIITGIYYVIRSSQMGIFSSEVEMHDQSSKWSYTKKNVVITIAIGFGLAFFFGIRNAIIYGDGMWNSIYYFFIVFAATLLLYLPVLAIIFIFSFTIAKKRSEKVAEKQLEELDGEDDEKY